MVEEQLIARGIRDPRVLGALATLPRERFVAPDLVAHAYADSALPSLEGQTISQPYIVARMLELLDADETHRVLEVGAGTGYQTALLAGLAREVFTVERQPDLARWALERLGDAGVTNVWLRVGDGTLGWPEHAPYDRVLVAAAAPRVPDALRTQLAVGGRLVIPVGGSQSQYLEVWRRTRSHHWEHERRGECRFVPLVGRDAWQERREFI
jgi:protein-L-isoaspartate(D-aspartate) O-methyltransferase